LEVAEVLVVRELLWLSGAVEAFAMVTKTDVHLHACRIEFILMDLLHKTLFPAGFFEIRMSSSKLLKAPSARDFEMEVTFHDAQSAELSWSEDVVNA
jgi:hypothetical protein